MFSKEGAKEKVEERRKKKQGNFRKETREIDSHPDFALCPPGILRLSVTRKSHGCVFPSLLSLTSKKIRLRKRKKEKEK